MGAMRQLEVKLCGGKLDLGTLPRARWVGVYRKLQGGCARYLRNRKFGRVRRSMGEKAGRRAVNFLAITAVLGIKCGITPHRGYFRKGSVLLLS